MRRELWAGCFALFTAGAMGVACSIDEGGDYDASTPIDATTDTFNPLDGAFDVYVDAYVDNSLPQACVTLDASCVPPYDTDAWTPVGIALDAGELCPISLSPDAGFTPVNRIRDPVAQAGACACGCEVFGTPNCNGVTKMDIFNAPGCSMSEGGTSVAVSGDASCVDASGPTSSSVKISPPTLTGISCDAGDIGDGGYTSTPVLACEPAGCNSDYCGLANKGFELCITASSPATTTCPSGYNVAKSFNVSTQAVVTCQGCGCSTIGNVCSAGTLTGFSDLACGTSNDSVPANGTCQSMPNPYQSVTYTAGSQTPTCGVLGGAPTSAQLVSKQLVCCP